MRFYSAREHERALALHERRWNAMHEIRALRGTANDDYRAARQDMVDAMRAARYAARLPRRPSHA